VPGHAAWESAEQFASNQLKIAVPGNVEAHLDFGLAFAEQENGDVRKA
jgi:hypothetical protein